MHLVITRLKGWCSSLFVSSLLSGSFSLTEPEPFASFPDREQQPLLQLLLVRVLRQIELVEARVRAAQPLPAAVRPVYLKPLRPADALQRLEPVQRHLARARAKHEQTRAVLVVQIADDVPEPPHLRRRGRVPGVLRLRAQILDVDLGRAGDQELQLARV
eukprot:25575-Pelagococcus_subviridis.AAC.2